MLTTITTIAGFSVGGLLLLLSIGLSIYGRSFGKDSLFMSVIGLIMIGLSTWQIMKPGAGEGEADYVSWDSVEQPSE